MNPLLRLLAENRGIGNFVVENAEDEATIFLYDAVVSDSYWGGVSALDFVKELHAIKSPVIHLRINCPGGEVFAGQAMATAIREHPSTVVAHVDGYAASAASWIALSCDEVRISAGGYFMIHKAMTVAWGNADEFKKQAGLLDKMDATLVEGYVVATGQSPEKIAEWMAEETWFNAEESVRYGFADSVSEAAPAKAMKQWNLSAYSRHPAPAQPLAAPALDISEQDATQHLRRRLALVEKQAA